jgi:adenosylcobinamide-GDP ribazoletransferase
MTPDPHLISAVRFLTVLPTPQTDDAPRPDWLARAVRYFPLVGAGIGAASACVWLIAGDVWPPVIAALMAVTASIALTGALHEDGLADTADSFGGGWSIEKRLAIMKDSRIGSFGALALGIGVALRVAALATLPPWIGAAALIASHALARATPGFVMNRLRYAGDTAAMKVSYAEVPVPPTEIRAVLLFAALAMLPLLILSLRSALLGLVLGVLLASLLARWSRRLLGGYTGDVLGAIEQVCEIGFLLGVAAVMR